MKELEIKILREKEVMGILGVSRDTLNRWVKNKSFPSPIQLGSRSKGWPKQVVDEWLAARIKQSA